MGNPHPTKSKPNKIGRKHTQGKRVWQRAAEEKSRVAHSEFMKAKRKKVESKIRQYWRGELDAYPE